MSKKVQGSIILWGTLWLDKPGKKDWPAAKISYKRNTVNPVKKRNNL